MAKQRKKLCFILSEYDPDTDSHYFPIYELLERVGQEVDLWLVFEHASSPPRFQYARRTYCQRFTWIPLSLLERLFLFVFIRLSGYRRFYVHYSVFSALLAALVTRLSFGKTFYWHCGHKSWFEHPWKLDTAIILEKLASDIPFRIALRWVNYLVTGAPAMKDYYAAEFKLASNKIQVMPNWVSLARFTLPIPDVALLRQRLDLPLDKKIVLFVHRLVERKGAQHIVPVAEPVLHIHDVCFVVIGDGPYRSRLARDIAVSHYTEHFKLIGAVPNRSLADYLAAADVLMMPSEEEGFPRILVEAMASGLPFVANDVGAVRDIVTPLQARFVAPLGDIPCFSQLLIDLLTDEPLRQKLAQEGLQHVPRFSLECVSETFINIISS